jgi:uncharacterized protein
MGVAMKWLVTGATGFVGTAVVRKLRERKDSFRVVTRDVASAAAALGQDLDAVALDAAPTALLSGVDAIVNLMGEPIFGRRWSKEQRRRIRASRVDGTRRLVEACAALPEGSRPKVLVSGSAVGFYGDRKDQEVDETTGPGVGFLADVCREWEEAALGAEKLGVRVVLVRTGVVLGPFGGALAQMLPIFKLGLGGRIGDGRQWMPWIHRDDLAGVFLHAADKVDLRGALNGTAPTPVRNADFTTALGAALKRPTVFPVPAFALRVLFGESAEILTTGQKVLPRRTLESGFTFKYQDVASALKDVV